MMSENLDLFFSLKGLGTGGLNNDPIIFVQISSMGGLSVRYLGAIFFIFLIFCLRGEKRSEFLCKLVVWALWFSEIIKWFFIIFLFMICLLDYRMTLFVYRKRLHSHLETFSKC